MLTPIKILMEFGKNPTKTAYVREWKYSKAQLCWQTLRFWG